MSLNDTVDRLNFTDAIDTWNTTNNTPNQTSGDINVNQGGQLSWKGLQDDFYTASYIIVPVLLCTGLFGNAVTICIMVSKTFKNMTSRYILIALALSDTTLILTQPFNKLFIRKLFGYDVRAISDVGCKTFFHIFKTAKMTSSWLIVILCFERFVAVVLPLKTKTIITKRTILGLIALDYLFIGTYNAVWTFSSLIVNGVCKPDVVTPETKQKYRDYLLAGSSFYSLIPMIVMTVLTPIIVVKLIQQRKKRRAMSSSSANSSKSDADTIRISAMLIGVVVAYVAFILPITIVHNLAFWKNVSAFDTNSKEFFVLREVAQMLEQLNYSTNFILYVLCSDKFRQKAIQLLRLDKIKCKKIKTSSKTPKTGSAEEAKEGSTPSTSKTA